ncbi:MAG: hypothetical protein U0N36_04165 [Eubacterium sp.]
MVIINKLKVLYLNKKYKDKTVSNAKNIIPTVWWLLGKTHLTIRPPSRGKIGKIFKVKSNKFILSFKKQKSTKLTAGPAAAIIASFTVEILFLYFNEAPQHERVKLSALSPKMYIAAI